MNPDEYRAPEAGRIVYTPTGHVAFVPAPLPPALSYTPELALALSQADAALGELSGIGRLLPNPHLLIASYIRREAVLSSRIEGTRTRLVDLFLNEAVGGRTRDPAGREAADLREVRAAELLQVSNPTARQAVGLLLENGLLEEITGRDWGRLYLARPILEAIDPASQPD